MPIVNANTEKSYKGLRYFCTDFVEIQRKSFYYLLEKGLIEEFLKRNPIKNIKKDLELSFYPSYYKLTLPTYNPREAILKGKSYTSQLYMPIQLIDKKNKLVKFKWVYIGNLPLMTKRGHFILNGAPRVIVNQLIRSPGIYYQEKLHENYSDKWSMKPDVSYKRYYADIICLRGTWLRLEIDKDKNIWAQMKKGPKIPVFWFLIGMGIPERMIFNSVYEPKRLIQNLLPATGGRRSEGLKSSPKKKQNPSILAQKDNALLTKNLTTSKGTSKTKYKYVKNPPEAWKEIYSLISPKKVKEDKTIVSSRVGDSVPPALQGYPLPKAGGRVPPKGFPLAPEALRLVPTPLNPTGLTSIEKKPGALPMHSRREYIANSSQTVLTTALNQNISLLSKPTASTLGRKWLFNKFMNPRTYDLGKQGRGAFNQKFNHMPQTGQQITESPTAFGLNWAIGKANCYSSTTYENTLTGLDLLFATDYLIKVEKGLKKIDDIDHLKNRRVRTSGELIQIQIGIAIIRLEKIIREKMNYGVPENQTTTESLNTIYTRTKQATLPDPQSITKGNTKLKKENMGLGSNSVTPSLSIHSLINSKAFNSALREFFGTSPLSQFMDQINPLAEITHKRRLTSMGPGGVTRDNATLAIRGIHPTHYGRICPIETPEGKNTGLVNSMTTYARVNHQGMIESPFYRVYKGIVLKSSGLYYFSAQQEEQIKLAAADLFVSSIGFLPKSSIPVRIAEDFTKISRGDVQYIGVSPLQMISIATSLIPFLEHDDANRALMGSNMQRQAVPLIRPERPIVGTGLEARSVSDSGHVVQSKYSGVVTYVSSKKIIVTRL